MNKRAPRRAVAPVAQPIAADLTKAADTLFEDVPSQLTLRDGSVLEVHTAKTRHAGLLLDFFHSLVNGLDKSQLIQIVSLIEESRKEKVAGGEDPKKESVEEVVEKVLSRSNLVITLFHSVYDVLPRVVDAMSNVSAEKFQDLDMDEGMSVAYRVFADNYRFFSQNLPVMARVFFQLAAEKISRK